MFDNNPGKCGPIFETLSPILIRKKILYVYIAKIATSPAQCVATLPCEIQKSKHFTDFDNSSLTNCWHVPEDALTTWFNI